MVKILHLSDIHMGSGFSHGRVNPETGLNTRVEDFVRTLGVCIDWAIAEPVDLVLFGGDAFPDATPPPFVQQAFASQFLPLGRCRDSHGAASGEPRSASARAKAELAYAFTGRWSAGVCDGRSPRNAPNSNPQRRNSSDDAALAHSLHAADAA